MLWLGEPAVARRRACSAVARWRLGVARRPCRYGGWLGAVAALERSGEAASFMSLPLFVFSSWHCAIATSAVRLLAASDNLMSLGAVDHFNLI